MSDHPVTVAVAARTDVGNEREHNEDNFLVADLTARTRALGGEPAPIGPRGVIMAVCDGMGGAAAGEIASDLGVETLFAELTGGDSSARSRDDVATNLEEAIQRASARIYDDAVQNPSRQGMGTTVTAAALADRHLVFGQVGDSRGYLLRAGKLVQITRDQSLLAKLLESGALKPEEADTFEHSNIILQALGASPQVIAEITYVELSRGDRLLLCSDGLSGLVPQVEIEAMLGQGDDPEAIAIDLIERAKEFGAHDNVTTVVAFFDGASLGDPSLPIQVKARSGSTELLAIPDPRQLGELLKPLGTGAGTAILTAAEPAPAPAAAPVAATATAAAAAEAAPTLPAPAESEPVEVEKGAPTPTPALLAKGGNGRVAEDPPSDPEFPKAPSVPNIEASPSEPRPTFESGPDWVAVPAGEGAVDGTSLAAASLAPVPARAGSNKVWIVAASILAVAVIGGTALFVLGDNKGATAAGSASPPASQPQGASTWMSVDAPPSADPPKVGENAGKPSADTSGSRAAATKPAQAAPVVPAAATAKPDARRGAAEPRTPAAAPRPSSAPAAAQSVRKSDLAPLRDGE